MKLKNQTLKLLFCLIALCVSGASTAERKILMLLTSADTMSNGEPTGLWLEEFAAPYELFKAEGYTMTMASPKGGRIPVDERSLENGPPVVGWAEAIMELHDTRKLSEMNAADFDAIFIPGGHGTIFDLPGHTEVIRLLRDFDEQNKVIASVCHGPAAFVGANKADGTPLVQGKTLTAFTDAEEKALKLESVVPFLLESELRKAGADFVPAAMWKSNIQVDGKLVTGQNPASSEAAAAAVIRLLK